ncbi:MAG: hypothetical protein QG646_195 [Euryarchaeota archaeon]|nr:hypothetical protein [Euryarchaeota archaeon]
MDKDKELNDRIESELPELCKIKYGTWTFTSVSEYKATLEKVSTEMEKWLENFYAELLKK